MARCVVLVFLTMLKSECLVDRFVAATLKVYGSFAYDLATFYSDVDMRVSVPSEDTNVLEHKSEGNTKGVNARDSTEDEGASLSEADTPAIHIATFGKPAAPSKRFVQVCLRKLRKEFTSKQPWVMESEARLRCRVPVFNLTSWNGLEVGGRTLLWVKSDDWVDL